jgi:DNA repair protein RecO (recombination protein O)
VSQEKAEAIVLRGVDYSETSRIVTFLTPERGLLTCIAKGVRRKNSALAPILDTFNRVELVYYWKEGRAVHTLGEASLLHPFSGIKGDLERSCFGAVPLELAVKTAHDNEPSQTFYSTLLHGMTCLEHWDGSARLHCAWQLARLLVAAGFAPELGCCVHCGGEIGHNSSFDLDGGAVCGQCPAERNLPRQALDDLAQLFDTAEGCPPVASDRALFATVRAYMCRQTESDYRSLRVLQDMFGS